MTLDTPIYANGAPIPDPPPRRQPRPGVRHYLKHNGSWWAWEDGRLYAVWARTIHKRTCT